MKSKTAKVVQRGMSMAEPEEIMVRQNKVIISLLARQAIGVKEIGKLVTRGKKNPKAYLKGYNACDGTKSVSDLAEAIGVTPGTLSPILQDWEVKGVVYDVGNSNKPLYIKLIPLEEQ